MVMTAQLHDGRTLEFPDGTDPAVIQRTVKSVLGVQEGQSIPQMLGGAANLAAAGIAGAGEQALGGLSQLGGLISGRGPEQAIQSAEALTQAIPDVPIGQNAQDLIQSISQQFNASPELVQTIVNSFSGLPEAAGEIGQKIGEPIGLGATFGAAASTIPAALEAATGLGAARQIPKAAIKAGQAAKTGTEAAVDVLTRQSAEKQRIGELIKSGSDDADVARFKINPKTKKVIDDDVAIQAINQGFDEGAIGAVKTSSTDDKIRMKKQVRIMERGKQNARFAVDNRPSDVAGRTLMDRINIIQGANKTAGQNIDRVAEKTMGGKPVDISAPSAKFADDLNALGVTLKDGKLDFSKSQLSPGDRGPLKEVVRQMQIHGEGGVDGLSAHKMKRIIDSNVTFGKVKTGMSGDAERVLKEFRTGIDDVLDIDFPEYNRVNTAYSETIDALNSFQDVAGKKMDLSGENAHKAVGTLLGRLMSNATSRVPLSEAVSKIDTIAKKYEGFQGQLDPRAIEGPKVSKIKGDVINQVLFADELDSVFSPVARKSLQGQLRQGVSEIGGIAAEAKVSPVTAVIKGGASLVDKARGINTKGAFKAIKKLLAE